MAQSCFELNPTSVMPATPHVVINNLVKEYEDSRGARTKAVNGINLEINNGEFMVFVGPSGCGKSTTLRMIAGLEEISAGTISIEGQVVNHLLPKDRDIAMVFQNYALYPHMSVFDNIAFGLKLRKFPAAEIRRRVEEAATMLGLETCLTRKPKELSGGQRQRVAVGRAVVRKPKVFLFDEPLSNLDAQMRVAMRAEIAALHARLKTTMIYVTHDQVEAMTMGHRICVMKSGDVMQVAEPLTLYHQPANSFVAGFIGTPPMNFFRGHLESRDLQTVFQEQNDRIIRVTLPLPAALVPRDIPVNHPVTLGFRPEDIYVLPGNSRPAHNVVEAQVLLIERLGAETHVHLTTGATNFIARMPGTHIAGLGDKVRAQFNLERAYLFDATSGSRL